MEPEERGLIGTWSPGIGDPTVIGWVTTVLYVLAAAGAWYAARRSKASAGRRFTSERTLWQLLALGYAMLGLNKQLDLQTAMFEAGRILSHSEGWYPYRRLVQRAFMVALGLGALGGGVLLVLLVRRASNSARLAAAGMALVLVFVVVRAALFNHMGYGLWHTPLDPRRSWVLEVGGVSISVAAIIRNVRSSIRSRPQR